MSRCRLRSLWSDTTGSLAIETAFIAPVLSLLSIGAYQASALIARQHELQSGVAEAETMALAKPPKTDIARNAIRGVLTTSLNLKQGQVRVTNMYRCGVDADYTQLRSDCASGDIVSTFLRIELNDTYVPSWTRLGIGGPVALKVVRMVQIS